MLKSQLKQLIKEEVRKILKENIDEQDIKKSRRFVPEIITLTKDIYDKFKEHFKLMKGQDGHKLYISPLLKSALEQIQRGRTSRDTRSKAGELVNNISDGIPNNIRAILKNFSNKVNPSVNGGMYSVNSKIKDVSSNGDINFFNPSNPNTKDAAYDPIVSEGE
jgi:hypothetical protein